jgi:Winged helix DNA-binding domain
LSRERVLTQPELNRALLARQLLLERAKLSLPRAVERLGGIQNQYAPNGYIRLWSCLHGFDRDALTRALARRSVVQATLMRGTIHLVSAEDFWPFSAGITRAWKEWWLRVNKKEIDLDATTEATREFLRGRTCTHQELEEFKRSIGAPGAPMQLVRVPPAGTWTKRRAHVFALADDWLGPSTVTEEEGLEHLVRRYLGAFGPSTQKEIANWAGVPAAFLDGPLARIRFRRFRNEAGAELLDLPRALLPPAGTTAPVRFLPTFDATLLVHARDTGILPEEYRPIIFRTKAPQSFPTFLVDGVVAGTWRYEDGRVRIAPFKRLSRAARQALTEEAERLTAFHS